MYRLFHYFHQQTKDKSEGGLVRIPKDRTKWPSSWNTVFYKTVERAPFIQLPPVLKTPADFQTILTERYSPASFGSEPLSLQALSTLLQLSYGEWDGKPGGRRPVPSGGARYPLELYVIAWDVTGLPEGVFHYNIERHGLEHFVWSEFHKEDLRQYVSYDWVQTGSALIVMSAVFERSTHKYGSRGYRYALLEAGHVGQNIYLTGNYAGAQARALAGTHDEAIEQLLDIDGTLESVVYAITIGT